MFNYKFRKRFKGIKKLKEDLMSKNPKNDNTVSSVRQVMNESTGKILEKNIRNILENNYGFKLLKYPEKIFIKKIRVEIGNKIQDEEIFQNEETTINIANKKYIFLFNEKFELLIKDSNNKTKTPILNNASNKESKVNLDGFNLTISPYKEMEIDGYFKMNKFKLEMFNENEIDVIYSNINKDDEKSFNNSIIEVKLNANKVDDLITQIRKDHHLLKLKNKKDTLVIGFINSNKIKNIAHFNSLDNKKCVIYGIKNSIFCGKEVTYHIDWDLERRVKSLEEKVDILNDLKPKIDKIYEYIMKQEKNDEEKKERANTLSIKEDEGKAKEKEEEKIKKEKQQKKKKEESRKGKECPEDEKLLNIKTKRDNFESEEEDLDLYD